jgi:hypothetical protein
MNVHGVVSSKNDWGNLAVAISYVIDNHADIVHVLDHGSKDRTADGLRVLKQLWGNRLRIYTAPNDLVFNQSLLTNLLSSKAEKEGADWIYVFDSDEFLLTEKKGLREELEGIDKHISSVRYNVFNYISPHDFNREDLDDYLRITYESQPTFEYEYEKAFSSIYAGLSTFFDYPFKSKVIFRANTNLIIQDGAHDLVWKTSDNSEVPLTSLKCAHLSYISRDILERKAMMGKGHIQDGYPKKFGWQSQLAYKIYQEGWLDKFWQHHSINEIDPSKNTKAKYFYNDDFKNAVSPTISKLKSFFSGSLLSNFSGIEIQPRTSYQSQFSFDEASDIASFYERRLRFLLYQINKMSIVTR